MMIKKNRNKKKRIERNLKKLLPFFCYLVYRERNHAFRAIRLEQSPHNGRGKLTTVETGGVINGTMVGKNG